MLRIETNASFCPVLWCSDADTLEKEYEQITKDVHVVCLLFGSGHGLTR